MIEDPKMTKSLWTVLLLALSVSVVAEEHARTVTVNGNGFAEVEPDRATLRLSIVVREPTLAAAQNEAAAVAGKVLEMTDRMNIDRDRVDTTGASVRPNYRWNRKTQEQELLGYIADRLIVVKIEDLEMLGAMIEGAVNAGVNQVTPPQLDSSRRGQAYREALRAAAEDARLNATELAESLGAKLGPVLRVNSGAVAPRPPVPHRANIMAMSAESDAVESYNPADLKFDATVTVVFELTE